ncbi:hypothetical protein [Pseudozobellia sp. WGM2]|uniref:hypothetical protein n=1 Tax=Pseudozobellia sp. WGM2 TaxID=2787625 RepID=UPI001ADF6369|nr:hypothetical protein [Pseudozobellia sp. WGM2]
MKSRIKSQFNFFGVVIPQEMDRPYWSTGFRRWLRGKLFEGSGQVLVNTQLEELESIEYKKSGLKNRLLFWPIGNIKRW